MLCENVTRRAEHEFDVPDDSQEADHFWKAETPELLIEYFEASGLEYDALVVDDGQDFRADWWSALACILDEDTSVCAFYDEHQDLFKAGSEKTLET